MPQLAIPVHYDFASTICFVAHRVLESMRADLDAMEVALDWRPIDLSSITGWRRGAIVDGPRLTEKVMFQQLADNKCRIIAELDIDAQQLMPSDAHAQDTLNRRLKADLSSLKQYVELKA